jgi:hypothetical protein
MASKDSSGAASSDDAEPDAGDDAASDSALSEATPETKAQICYDFTKGLCTRADKCKFSHDIATIVTFNSKEKGICFDYLRNQCHRGLLCRFSHDLSNIAQQCQVRRQGATRACAHRRHPCQPCAAPAGTVAPAHHSGRPTLAAPTASPLTAPRLWALPCAQQVFTGTTPKVRTTSICYDFVKGVCQRGSECRYSHDLSLIARTARNNPTGRPSDVCYDFLR